MKRGEGMAWALDNDRPIYLQLMERIQMDIISGKYPPGESFLLYANLHWMPQ